MGMQEISKKAQEVGKNIQEAGEKLRDNIEDGAAKIGGEIEKFLDSMKPEEYKLPEKKDGPTRKEILDQLK